MKSYWSADVRERDNTEQSSLTALLYTLYFIEPACWPIFCLDLYFTVIHTTS